MSAPHSLIRNSQAPDAELLRPPSSWANSSNHLLELIDNPWYKLLHRVRCCVDKATRDFFEGFGADNLPVPVTTTSVSSPMGLGSDSLPVSAIIQGNKVYLADSMQFLLELGLRTAGRPVYYISSSFRGEEVDATHLAEFSHSEIEVLGGLEDIIHIGSSYVSHLAKAVLHRCEAEVLQAAGSIGHLRAVADLDGRFERLRHSDALKLLRSRPGAVVEILPGVDSITRLGEQCLMQEVGSPLWLTHMPKMSCPFYQRPEVGTDACLSADLLLGPGEILGAGERCHDVDSTWASIEDHGVEATPYKWYLDMKRHSPLRTAGFGLGIERFLMWTLSVQDIRDCTMWLRKHGEVIDP